jgi:hypothetical protein
MRLKIKPASHPDPHHAPAERRHREGMAVASRPETGAGLIARQKPPASVKITV